MAIENTYLLGKNITLGCGFDLQAKAPLDSRQTVPAFEGLRALIIGDAAYEGMIVYDEGTKKTYQAQKCDSYTVEVDGKTKTYDIAFREFGINEAELKDLIASETTAAMEFKGATAALPENPAKGDMWKVTASFEVAGETTKVGDSIVYNGEEWFRIPSGDDIEDTWRPVTGVDNDAPLTFAAGDKLDVAVAANGTITYSHEAIDAPELLAENEQTRTYITEVETDGYGHITGYKTATENVVDTNTTYEFEGQSEDSSVYFTVTSNEENADPVTVHLDAYSKNETDTELAKKLDAGNWTNDSDTLQIDNGDSSLKILSSQILLEKAERSNIFDSKGVYVGLDADYTAYTYGSIKQKIWNDADEKFDITELNIPIKSGTLATEEHVASAISEIDLSVTTDKIVDKNVTKAKLAEDVQASLDLADSAVQEDDIAGLREASHAHTFVETELNKIADGDVSKWNDAYAHSQVAHAPADAQANVIESVKVNGTALEITDKAVDIIVPTGALADKDKVAKADLDEALATEIDNKIASVAAGDASVTVGGTATAPTVAAKISAAEGNALVLAEDGLKVIIPESTKVEASETNGNIKVDGQEVTVYTHPDSHTASEISDFATEVAKVKVDEAAKADEAIKATQDGNGKVIADTYAEKATTLAGYGIADAYTTAQVDDAIAAAKVDASNKDAVVLAESQTYTDNAITTVEGKVTELSGNVYTKEQTYTQAEVDALISAAQSWGEF